MLNRHRDRKRHEDRTTHPEDSERYFGGFNDPRLVDLSLARWNWKKIFSLILALAFITSVWLALDQKLLLGESWISPTYDNPDWRTNEGNLHTYGAWDIETHIWKTEYIVDNFPNFHWNPYWYLGMPLLKYYQSGFYIANILVIMSVGVDAARGALLLVIFGHLLATLLTFWVCYKVSRRIWVSAFASVFLLSNTFISLRSYGWEPITVAFLFLYPLGLYIFLHEPLRPFRFWMIMILGVSYLAHPLIWFSLCMFMGLYLTSIAIRNSNKEVNRRHYLWQYFGIVGLSLLIGAVQFFPQISYHQVTSGAHMGVQYLPFYQVAPNIIPLHAFFFDAGNLKGPGPIIMVSFLLLAVFAYFQYSKKGYGYIKRKIHEHELVSGVLIVLGTMVAFYYMERYNIFPMNLLRSIQYHRIIPEFLITSAILIAGLSNMIATHRQRIIYYSSLIAFVAASGILIFNVQTNWVTSSSISDAPEFINDDFEGRFSVPYTDQSMTVRNSFTLRPQVYGYYEQGITNSYADELFSVSSGYHNAPITLLYLKAANVERLYVNTEEGKRDFIVTQRLNGTLPYVSTGERYDYFEVGLKNPELVQAVDYELAKEVMEKEPGCREMFQERYCGSAGEEFVTRDYAEINYLESYVSLIESPYSNVSLDSTMINPSHYRISVENADESTAIIVKMTYDSSFKAKINNRLLPIGKIGPDFMIIAPGEEGSYVIDLQYGIDSFTLYGSVVSFVSVVLLIFYFGVSSLIGKRGYRAREDFHLSFRKGDIDE